MTEQSSVLAAVFNELSAFKTRLAVILTTAIICSVIYEVSYFATIDLRFFATLSPSDFIRLAIYWLPLHVGALILGMMWGVAQARHAGRNVVAQKITRISDGVLAYALLVVGIFGLIFSPDRGLPIIMASMASYRLLLFRLADKYIFSRATPVFAGLLHLAAAVTLLAVCVAHDNARRDLRRFTDPYWIETSAHAGLVIPLRILDKGVLYRRPGSGISFAPWNHLKELRNPREDRVPRSLFDQAREALWPAPLPTP